MIAALVGAGGSSFGPTLAVILGAGIVAQWLAWRAQVPSIIALLVTGLVLGPVTGLLDPDALLGATLFPLVSLAVALILFEGGLDLPPRALRNTGTVVRRLISVGAVVTFLVAWIGARVVFDLSNDVALVLGAVLVVTGPTVVGPLLRFVRPMGPTGPILRAESVLIDPIGATAALVAFEIVRRDRPDEAVVTVAGVVGLTIIAGIGIGLAVAFVLDLGLRHFLVPDQLTVPVTLAAVIAAFVATNEVQSEAGLLTVTVIGIYLARRESTTIRQVLEFNEHLRTLLISVLFILLAARIDTDALTDVLLPALGYLAVLVLVARPLSVLVSTVRTSLPWRERLFLMTMAPRGIVAASVSAIFALRLEEVGVPDADTIVPIMFLVIIGTIVFYGFLAGPAARALGLADPHADGLLIVGAHAVARGFAAALQDKGVKTLLVDTDPYNVTRAVALGLPAQRMSILAEDADTALDLRGVGRLLAFTSNDEANTLATARFARAFGRREVFQLKPGRRRPGDTVVPEEFLGRVIGIEGITYATLDERSREGWRVRSVPAGRVPAKAFEDHHFVPFARVVGGRLAFLCSNDAMPTEGDVIGLAAPAFMAALDAQDAQGGLEVQEAADEPTTD